MAKVRIRNKRTGEIREVEEGELSNYKIVPSQTTSPRQSAVSGNQEVPEDFESLEESFQQASRLKQFTPEQRRTAGKMGIRDAATLTAFLAAPKAFRDAWILAMSERFASGIEREDPYRWTPRKVTQSLARYQADTGGEADWATKILGNSGLEGINLGK